MATATTPAALTGVFVAYRRDTWPHGTVRMACFTPDTLEVIRAEPGVLIKKTDGGYQVFTADGWVPLPFGAYVVRYGHGPERTAVVAADYALENYTRASQ